MLKILLLLAAWSWAAGVHAFTLSNDVERLPLSSQVEVLEDPSGRLTFDQLRTPEQAGRFRAPPSDGADLNLGLSGSAFWVRWTLQRTEDADAKWLLEIPFAQVNALELHAPGSPVVRTGSDLPLASRPVQDRFFVFPLSVGTTPGTYYLRVASSNPLTVSPTLWHPPAFERKTRLTLVAQALYYGGWLALLVYNLFFFITLKDFRFLLYVGYALFMGLGMFAGNGFGRQYLWPDAAAFDAVGQVVFFSLAGALSLLLAQRFLQQNRVSPWFGAMAKACACAFVVAAALLLASVRWPLALSDLLTSLMLLSCLTGIAILAASIQSLLRGQQSARFFVLAWGILWLGVVVASLRSLGWVPTHTLTAYALQIASSVEMVLLALALGDVIRIERKTHADAQQQLLDSQAEMLVLRKSSEERLARLVNERTAQLELALAHEQALVVQSRRFASLVSHEFRNPLGIISSQLSLLRKEHAAGLDRTEKRLSIMGGATRRLTQIFDKWLQNDRQQRSQQALAVRAIDLAAWLGHLLEANGFHLHTHDARLHLDPGLTTVQADEHQLEIALSNLLENASKFSAPGTRITVATRSKPGFIGIAVTDEGPGIAPQHQSAVFEEFFRVSPEGTVRGMGLGLPIVRRIIEAHGGHLELCSPQGQGCTFSAWLPDPSPGSGITGATA